MLYQLKKFLLRPLTAVRRRRAEEAGHAMNMLELHYYRKPILEFAGVMSVKPDLLSDFDLPNGAIIVDVGAFNGKWISSMAERYQGIGHGYEPLPGMSKKFTDSVAGRDDVYAHAVGLASETFRTRLSRAGMGSSIYEVENQEDTVEVQIVAGDEAFRSAGIDRIDLIKINIEGAEYDLLEHLLDKDWANRIDQFLIQFHEWHPWAYWRRYKIRRRLCRTHEQVWDFNFVFEYWRAKNNP